MITLDIGFQLVLPQSAKKAFASLGLQGIVYTL
jgi:hypothetical protein